MRKLPLIVLFFTIVINSAFADQFGQTWEFEQEGDFEGWEALFFLSDAQVTGGCLQATINGSFPAIKSPEFSLPAAEYGFIEMRVRVENATSARVMWNSLDGGNGFQSFTTVEDTGFHVYQIPLYKNDKWSGEIIQLSKIEWSIASSGFGQTMMIDYIRIVSKGAIPEIVNFKALRTICKPEQPFPFIVTIQNNGDRRGDFDVFLDLPSELQVTNGEAVSFSCSLLPNQKNTSEWSLEGSSIGNYKLRLFINQSETDAVSDSLQLTITDQYWQQRDFFLSAWSPPSTNEESYQIYKDANFDHILSLYLPYDENCQRVEQFDFKCQLRLGSLIGEHDYLRAPDNIRPENLTNEQLTVLDEPIEEFLERHSVSGYYITDEPNALAFPNLAKVVAYIRERDPTRLSFINLFPTYANEEQLGTETYDEHVEKYLDVVKPELLSYDHYHFFKGYDGGGYFDNLGIVRKWAQRYDIPFCNIIQAVGYDVLNWRIPSPEEHRWLVYSSLAYGAKALIWFHWDHDWGVTGSEAYDQLYASIRKLNIEIKNLGPELLPLRSKGIYHSDVDPPNPLALPADGIIASTGEKSLVIGEFKDHNDGDFLMIMNKSYENPVTVSIQIRSQISSLAVFNADSGFYEIREDYEVSEHGTTFDIILLPGQGKLIKYSGTPVSKLGESWPEPKGYHLEQNYPNPFNPSTKINLSLQKSENVILEVYNNLGQKISTLVDRKMYPGRHEIEFDASKLASGIYYYTVYAGNFRDIKKMMVLK